MGRNLTVVECHAAEAATVVGREATEASLVTTVVTTVAHHLPIIRWDTRVDITRVHLHGSSLTRVNRPTRLRLRPLNGVVCLVGLQDRSEDAMIQDPLAALFHPKACHHIMERHHPYRPTVRHHRWVPMAVIRSTLMRPAWTSTGHMAQPVPRVTALPVPSRLAMLRMATDKAPTEQRPSPPPGTLLAQSTTPATMITALERTIRDTRLVIRRTIANRTVPRPITAPFPRRHTPVSSMTIGQVTPVMTRKPTPRAMQRPISMRMVVITRQSTVKKRNRESM